MISGSFGGVTAGVGSVLVSYPGCRQAAISQEGEWGKNEEMKNCFCHLLFFLGGQLLYLWLAAPNHNRKTEMAQSLLV